MTSPGFGVDNKRSGPVSQQYNGEVSRFMSHRQKENRKPPMPRKLLPVLVVAIVVVAGIAIAVVFLSGESDSEDAKLTKQESIQAAVDADGSTSEQSEEPKGDQLVADDGKTLWVSPTAGEPVSLSYLPSGTQLLLHLRPAEILAHPEGEKIVAALGPWGGNSIKHLQSATGMDLAKVAALTMAIHPTVSGELHTTWRLKLQDPLPEDVTLPTSAYRTSFIPPEQERRLIVSCHPDDLRELQEQGDEPALFPRDMQLLLDRTDRLRSATLVMTAKFFKIEGHQMLRGRTEQLGTVLDSLAGERATAIALSAHWEDDFFLELQSNAKLNVSAYHLALNLQRWISEATTALESALTTRPPHQHGRKIVTRFPAMLELLSTYTRGTEIDGVSVLRCYMPRVAGHNLLMASELALSLPDDAPALTSDESAPRSLREKLQQVTSLSFPKDTLERALEILAEELEVEIRIAGGDLQLEGITKNQSFAINLRHKTAEKILQAIMSQANPDRTAESLADPKQKLVYVLQNPDSPQGVVVVTTRTAVEKRGETLPNAFVQQKE